MGLRVSREMEVPTFRLMDFLDGNIGGRFFPRDTAFKRFWLTLQRAAGDPHADTPISRDGADGVSSGAPDANAEGGDAVANVVTISGPRTTLASARDPETVLYRVKHEKRRSKPANFQQHAVEVFYGLRCRSLSFVPGMILRDRWL